MAHAHQAIREHAYRIWEREGRPDGRALAHWVLATEELGEADAPRPDGADTAEPAAAKTPLGDGADLEA